MSNVFVIIKMCYVHNQWYDISCATLYNMRANVKMLYNRIVTVTVLRKFTVCGESALHKLNLG